jgi:signal transduction histidine kinase
MRVVSEAVQAETAVATVVRDPRRSARPPIRVPVAQLVPIAALVLGCALTALSFQSSWVRLAYRLPRMHGVLETAIGLVSVLVAYLFYGRVRAFGRWRDLVLAFALGFGAAVHLFAAITQGVTSVPPDRLEVWTITFGRLLVALLFATAALLPADRSGPPAPVPRFLFGVAIAFYALVAVVAISALQLPWSEDLTTSPTDASKPLFVGPPLLLVLEAIVPVAYSVAGWRFIRLARGDGLMIWVSSACMLFSLASLHYLAFPSLFSDWIYVGDLLALAGVLLLLVGAAHEIRGYWQRTAALDERRKLAYELHDGVAQELAYIATMASRLERDSDHQKVRRLADAAQHALDESRLVIATLAGAGNPAEQLALTARDAAHRFDLDVAVDVPEVVELPSEVVEMLLRIVRESINNAGRYANATMVGVQLRLDSGVSLVVEDDGHGFDTAQQTEGFGMRSMRERAETLGGIFTLTSVPGRGTTVRIDIPPA